MVENLNRFKFLKGSHGTYFIDVSDNGLIGKGG